MTHSEYAAALHRERFGDPREFWRESAAQPLPLPTDRPADWWRRQQVLLDTLDGCPQHYRRRQEAA